MGTQSGTAERVAAALLVEDPLAHGMVRARLFGGESPHIGRYAIVGRIGAGGMGVVYRARDAALDREVALKTLSAIADPQLAERLAREAKALARLSHPNVVQIYDVGLHHERVYIAMELIDGENLRHWQRDRSASEIVAAYCAAGRGIAAAHAAGLLHRDIKPENVLVGHDGRPRVVDFGLAAEGMIPSTSDDDRVAAEPGPRSTPMGTPAYMAPEHRKGERTDVRADVFSFCVALFEALAGSHPFLAERVHNRSIATGHIDWTLLPPTTPRHVRAALERGLARGRDERFATMDELLRAFDRPPRRGAVGVVVALGCMLAGFFVIARSDATTSTACDELEPAAPWDGGTAERLSAAFVRAQPGFGASTWEAVGGRLSDEATAWNATRDRMCDGSMSARALAVGVPCLATARARLATLIELLHSGDPKAVERASQSIEALPSVGDCLALADAPPARQRSDAALAVEDRIARLGVELDVGRVADVASVIDEVVAEAEATDDPGAKVHAWLLHARIMNRSTPELRNRRLSDAYFLASEAELGPEAVTAATRLVEAFVNAKEPASAEVWLAHAEAAIAQFGIVGARVVDLAMEHANLLVLGGKLDEAEAILRARIAELDARGDESSQRVDLVVELGNLMLSRRRPREAEAALTEGYEYYARAVGLDHPDVVPELVGLASAVGMQGNRARAEALLLDAASIVEGARPLEEDKLIVIYSNLANALGRTQPERALAHAREALGLAEGSGASPLTLAEIHDTIGNLQRHRGDLDEASAHYERSRALIEASLGADHPELGHPLNALGNVRRERGDLETAVQLYRRALTLWTSAYGTTHPILALPLQGLGEVELARDRPADAIDSLRRALALRLENPGDRVKVAQVRFLLARALWPEPTTRHEAVESAKAARDDYASANEEARDLANVDAWLASRALD